MPHPVWKEYLEATRDRGARPLLERALDALNGTGRALDVGCGSGGDALALLGQGFEVLAVDSLEEALVHTRSRARAARLDAKLETLHTRFEDLTLKPSAFLLAFAAYSLPFCERAAFPALFRDLCGSLAPSGVFAGQFFGDRDQWAKEPDHPARTFFSKHELEVLLRPLETLVFEEVEERRPTALGQPKDWHVFHVVARRPSESGPA